ncbi:hypothetical protein BDF19DRAFT_445374 [Syncephalis fuscata]|nr:hypothetical protein BDF19DRAFT_445374 [Syncephalis fuscata]
MYAKTLLSVLCTSLIFTTTLAVQTTTVIPPSEVKSTCTDAVSQYVKYSVKVTSGGLTAVYLSPVSNAQSYELAANNGSKLTLFTVLYDRLNSCAKSTVNGVLVPRTECSAGKTYPSKTVSITEPYCLVFDNTMGNISATVEADYTFTNSSTSSILPNGDKSTSNSDGKNNGILGGLFNSANTNSFSIFNYLLITFIAIAIAFLSQ